MSVKFRSVNTRELNFITNLHTARSTHTGSVNHDRVDTDNRMYSEFFGKKAYKLHHDHRSYSYTVVILFTKIVYEIFNRIRNHSASAVTSVICCYIEIAGNFLHLLLKNNKILCLGTDNNISGNTVFMEPFNLWINRSSSKTARNKKNLFLLNIFNIVCNKIGRTSKRSYEIFKIISCLKL